MLLLGGCQLFESRNERKESNLVLKCSVFVHSETMPNKFLKSYFSAYTKRHLVLHYNLWTEPRHAFLLNFRDRAFFYSNLHSYNYSVLVQIWCRPLLLDLCPLRSRRKCVSWLTAGWGTWLQLQHLVLPNWGDSLLGSLWKLTAKHSQLDLRYLERLSFFTLNKSRPR